MSTTTTSGGGGDFVSNLGRIYGIYTGGFIAFIILMAILSAVGVPNVIIGYMFVGFTILIYAVIGILSPHHASRRILCRRPPRARDLQWHGDRRGLDVGRLLRRHGRHALSAGL